MYQSLSNDYDRFVNWPNRLAFELPFIEQQVSLLKSISSQPLYILDAACGTGMHAIALAQKGYAVSAADLFPEMIAKTVENASKAGVSLKTAVVGFGDLAKEFGAGRFDLLLCLGNSLPHLLSREALASALSDFSGCLRTGGRLLIQNRNFDAVMAKKERWMEPQTHIEGEEQWIFQRFYDFEPDGKIHFNIVTLKREGSGEWAPSATSTTLRPQLQSEMVAELTLAGFREIESFGSMTGEPFSLASSGNLVLNAVKA